MYHDRDIEPRPFYEKEQEREEKENAKVERAEAEREEVKPNKFQCALCNGVYEKGWTDEEALIEGIENFGREMNAGMEMDLICDDCYKRLFPNQ